MCQPSLPRSVWKRFSSLSITVPSWPQVADADHLLAVAQEFNGAEALAKGNVLVIAEVQGGEHQRRVAMERVLDLLPLGPGELQARRHPGGHVLRACSQAV